MPLTSVDLNPELHSLQQHELIFMSAKMQVATWHRLSAQIQPVTIAVTSYLTQQSFCDCKLLAPVHTISNVVISNGIVKLTVLSIVVSMFTCTLLKRTVALHHH